MSTPESPFPYVKGLSARTPEEKEAARKKDQASHTRLRSLQKRPGNDVCADCTARFPGWAALPHGVFICIDCAQLHRHLGRHISQVKAINTGTYLWYEDEINAMEVMGNDIANRYFYGASGTQKPSKSESRDVKERHLRMKYETKKWFTTSPPAAATPTKTTSSPAKKASSPPKKTRSAPQTKAPVTNVAPKKTEATLIDASWDSWGDWSAPTAPTTTTTTTTTTTSFNNNNTSFNNNNTSFNNQNSFFGPSMSVAQPQITTPQSMPTMVNDPMMMMMGGEQQQQSYDSRKRDIMACFQR